CKSFEKASKFRSRYASASAVINSASLLAMTGGLGGTGGDFSGEKIQPENATVASAMAISARDRSPRKRDIANSSRSLDGRTGRSITPRAGESTPATPATILGTSA